MKFFNKQETIVVSFILLFIIGLSLFNFNLSLRRARDVQRRVDLGNLYNALNDYFRDYGFYPPSSVEGKIIACKGDNFNEIVEELKNEKKMNLDLYFRGLRPCEWAVDSFSDVLNQGSDYISTLPRDPKAKIGYRYFYISDRQNFQIYAYLEGEQSEIGFDQKIVVRNIDCGGVVCNFGRANGATPLDKSLQEYENELIHQEKAKDAI